MRMAALAVCCLLLASCSGGRLCGPLSLSSLWPWQTQGQLPSALEVRSLNGVAKVELEAVLDAKGAPAFAYGGTAGPAPTIRVHPGERIEVTLRNSLPSGGMHSDVNLHFHGLAVAPKQPGDEVFATLAHPGQTVRYRVEIPNDHPPGLYWYHPHAHGATFDQVGSGMSGAIVIEGIEEHIPALAQMRERILVLRDVPLHPHHGASSAQLAVVDDDITGGDPCRPETEKQVTINGTIRPHIAIAPGERQFFRVLNASAKRYFDLSIGAAPLQLVELDGVPLDAYPGAAAVRTVRHLVVPPAGRAEFVVTGGSTAATLNSACFDSGPGGDPQPTAILADIGNGAPRADAALAAPLSGGSKLTVEAPLSAGTLTEPLPAPAARRTIRLSEDKHGFYIDGKAFDPRAAPGITVRSGTVETWMVLNDTDEVHAFHLHQVHVAVERIGNDPQRVLNWLDIVNVPPRTHYYGGSTRPGSVTLLVDFRNPAVRGVLAYHCHILDHEDRGMMAKVLVR